MLKYKQTARHVASSVASDGELQVKLTNSTALSIIQQRKLRRKQSGSYKVKSKSTSEISHKLIRGSRRHLSVRAKSSKSQTEENPREIVQSNQKAKTASNMRKFVQTKYTRSFSNWTTDDMCEWLRSNNLDHDNMLAIQFRSTQLCGSQLIVPDLAWEKMNAYKYQDEKHKQEVLIKLAECISEMNNANMKKSASCDHLRQSSNRHMRVSPALSYSNDSLISTSDYVSASSASSTALTSLEMECFHAPDESLVSSPCVCQHKMSKSSPNLKTLVNKLKPNFKSDYKSNAQLHPIALYLDIESPGNFTKTELHITETTTTIELIQLYLDFSGLTEDINLFMLSEVSLAPSPEGRDAKRSSSFLSRRVLDSDEFPLSACKSFAPTKNGVTSRLELTQGKGVVIKVTCRIANHKHRVKQFRISVQSSVDHMIKLALRKFRLRNVDPGLFALCEVCFSGEFSEVERSSNHRWQTGASLVLCDRPSLEQLNKEGDNSPKGKFLRSISITSHSSRRSGGTSCSSDSWTPLKLDIKGQLGGEILGSVPITDWYSFQTSDCDVTIDEISCADIESHDRNMSQSDINSLSVENAFLRSELREKEDQMDEMRMKVTEVRRVLESGLQQYHDGSLSDTNEHSIRASLAIENELRITEELINNTEEMLGHLFCHQRQVISKHIRESSIQSRGSAGGSTDSVMTDNVGITDIELRIASLQADLLALKHKHQILDMKMSLFMANKKAEKFRQMINGSLFNILDHDQSKTLYSNTHFDSDTTFTIHSCETCCGNSGYSLSLKDEKYLSQPNSAKLKGTTLDCDYQQGMLLKGDRLIEVNGVNVQSAGKEFINRLLKGTTAARLVVLRKSCSDQNSPCNIQEDQDEIIPSPVEDDDDVMSSHFSSDKFGAGKSQLADWRDVNALQSDLSMLMRELEITSRAKSDLERDLALRKNRDVVLESENARLKKQIEELVRKRQTSVDYVSC